MEMPLDAAGSLLAAATQAQRRAKSDRAWLWIPMRVFAVLTLLSAASYIDWHNHGANGSMLVYESGVWSRTADERLLSRLSGVWSWEGGNVWPILYWLVAAAFGTWLSQRLVRRREDRVGVRLGTAVPLLITVLTALLVARLLVNWSYPGPEIIAVPLGLLALATLERDYRAAAGLVATVALAALFVLINRDMALFQWVIIVEVALIALALLLTSLMARPSRRSREGADASRA